ncbi:MAG: radical SAM protein [Desulfobacterales bacterium]|jgi:radical SAM superfamily enzyme YgiQ (UPF0313 family)|nr:radical SAM protein [Desulfobacterales bacterium]
MVDILLVQPPIRDFYLTAKRTVPYGLASIAAALGAKGFSVNLLDGLASAKSRPLQPPLEMSYLADYYGRPDSSPFGLFHQFRHFGYSYQHIQKMAQSSGAFLVGISALFTPYIEEAFATARAIRAALPTCNIVLGGHHPTALPAHAMTCPHVDFVLRGEGENSLPALALAIKNGTPLSEVPGLVFRRKDGALHVGAPAVMTSLNDAPPPARRLIRDDFYRRKGRGATVIVTSRGCPMTCSYCALGNHQLYPYRRRRLDDVLEEIADAVLHHDARFIDFEDENLSLDRDWFLTLLRAITTNFGRFELELRAMNGLFPPTLDDEVIAAMKAAGFRTLNLSLGSACPDQLQRFHRPNVRRSFDRALETAEKHGMDAVGYIIVGAPWQNPEDSLTDLLFLTARRVLAGVSVYYPAPASKDYEICDALGLLPEAFSLMRASTLPISHTTTRLEAVTLVRLGRMINFMKEIIDSGTPLPQPASPDSYGQIAIEDREPLGILLLSWFLFDGRIWGVTPQGECYPHRVSPALTSSFLKRLRDRPLRGRLSKSA